MNRPGESSQAGSLESTRFEEDRIRAAYANRQRNGRYSLFSPGHLFIIQEAERHLTSFLKKHDFASLDSKQILEIGCGTGFWLREFIQWGARPENIFGIDLLPERVAEAKTLSPAPLRIHCGSAAELSFPDATFDLVFQATVFTSILDRSLKQKIAAEMLRVLKRDGLIVWYDYHANNPWNRDVRGIKMGEIHELFRGCRIDLKRITLVPPLCRFLAPYSWTVCSLLENIPWLCTHYIGVIKRERN